MIEREFIKDKIKQMNVRDSIHRKLPKSAGIGGIQIEKTPMGEKIVVHSTRPGMIIGRGGQTIKALTKSLKSKFKLENPQIETSEIVNGSLNAQVIAKKIAAELERFGPNRFKGIGYRELSNVLKAGALGAEIIIKGKIPGKRSKTWRFYGGYMKKRGDIFDQFLDRGEETAVLRSGTVGINVLLMHEDTPLPDRIAIQEPPQLEEVSETEALKEAKKQMAAEKSEAPAGSDTSSHQKKEEKPKAEVKETPKEEVKKEEKKSEPKAADKKEEKPEKKESKE